MSDNILVLKSKTLSEEIITPNYYTSGFFAIKQILLRKKNATYHTNISSKIHSSIKKSNILAIYIESTSRIKS